MVEVPDGPFRNNGDCHAAGQVGTAAAATRCASAAAASPDHSVCQASAAATFALCSRLMQRVVNLAKPVIARFFLERIVPEARGESERVRSQAEGYKTAEIARATGDATRFSLLLDEYRNAPEVTRKRLWLDTVQQVLADNRKVIGGDSRQLIYVPMGNSAQAAAQPPAGVIPTEVLPQVESTPSSSRNSARTPRPAGREEAQP